MIGVLNNWPQKSLGGPCECYLFRSKRQPRTLMAQCGSFQMQTWLVLLLFLNKFSPQLATLSFYSSEHQLKMPLKFQGLNSSSCTSCIITNTTLIFKCNMWKSQCLGAETWGLMGQTFTSCPSKTTQQKLKFMEGHHGGKILYEQPPWYIPSTFIHQLPSMIRKLQLKCLKIVGTFREHCEFCYQCRWNSKDQTWAWRIFVPLSHLAVETQEGALFSWSPFQWCICLLSLFFLCNFICHTIWCFPSNMQLYIFTLKLKVWFRGYFLAKFWRWLFFIL